MEQTDTQFRRSQRLHKNIQNNLTQKRVKMGNKAKQEVTMHTCDVCDNKFQTLAALKSHKKAKHQEIVNKEPSPPKEEAPKAPKNTLSRASKRLKLKLGLNSESEDSEIEEKKTKVAFSCPICDKKFIIYFQALKHIQKMHCVDSAGNPVSADSPDLIKPLTDDDNMPADNSMTLPSSVEDRSPSSKSKNMIFCLGCDQNFKSVVLFNQHATLTHRDDVDSMFFKSLEEFNMWKQMMQSQVKVKYLSIKDQNLLRFYHCNYVSPDNDLDKTYLCPSVIYVKDLGTGVQIHYSKVHFGHTCPVYQLPDSFQNNITNRNEIKTGSALIFDKLYLKLKGLLEYISKEAGKVSYNHLESIYSSALKMKSLLNEADEKVPVSLIMTDDQITDELEFEGKRTSARLKRKSETAPVDAKKTKVNDELKSKKNEALLKENRESKTSSPVDLQTFNDSYKQFIGSPKPEAKSKTKRKEVIRTKIGQYSPKKRDTDESKHNILKLSKNNSDKILKYEVLEQKNDCNILVLKF